MKLRMTAVAISGLMVAGLVAGAPAAHADTAKVDDKVGDQKVLDIRSAKLNNGKHRLAGTVTFRRKSMRSHGTAGLQLLYRKPRVIYGLRIRWRKHKAARAYVARLRPGRKMQVITKRCDPRVRRYRNHVRISVNQKRCFRRDAGRVRFQAYGLGRGGSDDLAPNGRLSRPVRRG